MQASGKARDLPATNQINQKAVRDSRETERRRKRASRVHATAILQ